MIHNQSKTTVIMGSVILYSILLITALHSSQELTIYPLIVHECIVRDVILPMMPTSLLGVISRTSKQGQQQVQLAIAERKRTRATKLKQFVESSANRYDNPPSIIYSNDKLAAAYTTTEQENTWRFESTQHVMNGVKTYALIFYYVYAKSETEVFEQKTTYVDNDRGICIGKPVFINNMVAFWYQEFSNLHKKKGWFAPEINTTAIDIYKNTIYTHPFEPNIIFNKKELTVWKNFLSNHYKSYLQFPEAQYTLYNLLVRYAPEHVVSYIVHCCSHILYSDIDHAIKTPFGRLTLSHMPEAYNVSNYEGCLSYITFQSSGQTFFATAFRSHVQDKQNSLYADPIQEMDPEKRTSKIGEWKDFLYHLNCKRFVTADSKESKLQKEHFFIYDSLSNYFRVFILENHSVIHMSHEIELPQGILPGTLHMQNNTILGKKGENLPPIRIKEAIKIEKRHDHFKDTRPPCVVV